MEFTANMFLSVKCSSAGIVSGWTYIKAYIQTWSWWPSWNFFSCVYLSTIVDCCVYVFLIVTFWCCTCQNLQQYLTMIPFFFCLFLNLHVGSLNRLSYISSLGGGISRLLFVLFPRRATSFSSTIIMSHLPQIFPTLTSFLDLPYFLNHDTAFYL